MSSHCGIPLFLITLSVLYFNSFLVASQNNPQVEELVKNIFSSTSQTRAGFETIVTPEPIDPSKPQPKFTSVSGAAPCNCVPYHRCDPRTNTVTSSDVDGEPFDGFGLIDIRIDAPEAAVCENVLEKCCDDNRTRTDSLTPTSIAKQPNRAMGCGIRNVGGIDFKLVGANNNEAGFGEYPWTVALLQAHNSSYFCAGSLIHNQVVLTSTHCVIKKAPNSFLVRAGEWDTQTAEERLPYVERAVRRIITHPQYNPRNVAYDFALLILSEPLVLDDHINVVCLPFQGAEPIPPVTCLSAGWGKDQFGASGRWSTILKSVPLPIVDYSECQTRLRQTRLGPRFALDRSFICAGGQRNIDTCEGDGGAPLICPIGLSSENRYQQNGIVAWGIGCNDEIPAAYANVALVRNWIDEQMLANGFDTTSYSPF